jgi:hypothetical protein
MDRKLIDNINKQVYQKFPEVNGVKPVQTARPGEQVLLVYKGVGITADGRSIQRSVRVVSDASGKIIKMTTSK